MFGKRPIQKGDVADVSKFGPLHMTLVVNSHGELYEGRVSGVERANVVQIKTARQYLSVILSETALSKVGRAIVEGIDGDLTAAQYRLEPPA
jgi:hypothetical protein